MLMHLALWEDVGYTEGCLERPHKTSVLPSPVFETDIVPARAELFTRARVKGDFWTLRNVSYLRAVIESDDGDMATYYGWIDSVSLSSDNPDCPMVFIDWHIDNWRTFLPSAVFGAGMVKRRTATDDIPPQSYPYRYMLYKDRYNVIIPEQFFFVVFNFTAMDSDTKLSTVKWGCYKVSAVEPAVSYPVKDGLDVPPSLMGTLSGSFDEAFGLDPTSINGCWLSPVAPREYDETAPFALLGWGVDSKYCNGRCLIAKGSAPFGQAFERSLLVAESWPYCPMPYPDGTTDTYTYTLTGFQGEPIGVLPWGIKVEYLHFSLLATTDSLNIRIWLARDKTQTLQSSTAEGLVFTYPCPSVGLSSNAYSSYIYSGARQAEIEQRRLSNEQTRDQGLGTSSTLGSITTTLSGSALAGGIMGLFTGGLKKVSQAEASYKVTKNYNDEFQKVSDYQASNQTNTSLLASGCFDMLTNGINGIWLVKTVKDDYSLAQRAKDMELYGGTVSEPTESCQALIDAGGPVQITNLTVTGPIPPDAKDYFRTAFAGGVRIV